MYNEDLRSEKKLIKSSDGSFTLYSKEFEEPYHSTNDGALHESLQKHVIPALKLKQDKEYLTILDICFGLGYNSFATIYYMKKHGMKNKIHIISPEFDRELVESLKDFEYPSEFDDIANIINSVSCDKHYEDEQFVVDVLVGDARDIIRGRVSNKQINIIYQDAFSPKVNPLLWTHEWFANLRNISSKDVILTTYASAASVRMALDENHFNIYHYHAENSRPSLIASPSKIEGYEWIDMELKKQRNPSARSFRDIDFTSSKNSLRY